MFVYEMLRFRETKQFRRKIVIAQPLFSLFPLTFFDTKYFLKHRRDPLRFFFGPVKQTIPTEILHTPSLLLASKFFDTRSFFEALKGSSTESFGTVRRKKSTESCDKPLLSTTFFDKRNFLKRRSVRLRNVSVP